MATVKQVVSVFEAIDRFASSGVQVRGKDIAKAHVEFHSGFTGLICAALDSGKNTDLPENEGAVCVFRGPEELLAILSGKETGDWRLEDEWP